MNDIEIMKDIYERLNALDVNTKICVLALCEKLNHNNSLQIHERLREEWKKIERKINLKFSESDIPIVEWQDETWTNRMKDYGLRRVSLNGRVG
jgi:hypothetical protein